MSARGGSDDRGPIMTFLQFFRLLKARWLMLAGGAAIGLMLAFIWVLFSDKSYQATAQVLIDVRAPETLGKQSSEADQLAPDYLSTQTDIMQSERVRLKVVEKLGLASNPKARADSQSVARSEERRVGKEGVSTCRSRWSQYQ